jgi:hypothetical protein
MDREAAIERRDEKIRELEEELSRQCLNGRIGDRDTLATEIAAWEAARNKQRASIHWQFTVDEARRKLGRLYPAQSKSRLYRGGDARP